MEEAVKEIFSPSGKYKAVITEEKDFNCFDVYILNEDSYAEDNCSNSEYWLKKNNNPIFVDKGMCAEHIAIEELRKYIGGPDIPLTIVWIKEFSFCETATFISPEKVNVYCNFIDPENKEQKRDIIDVKQIIYFDGLCLVEEIGEEDDWQMGQIDSKSDIFCWGYYGTLKEAIKAL
jgi:hypothetical protein